MPSEPTVMQVSDLVSTASLGATVLAGSSGLEREVLWAHSCEMSAPEEWLGPHELLMTVGLCIPHAANEQAEFIARLDEAGLSGIMIGDHDTAPPITEELIAEADRRGFPVLFVDAQTPYTAVARMVAAANSSTQILQVLKLSKLYQVATTADDTESMLTALSLLLRAGIEIQDSETGLTLIAADATPDGSADSAERQRRRYPLRGSYPTTLVLTEYPGEPVESFILVNLLKVLEVAVDRELASVGARVDAGARAVERMLEGSLPPDADALLNGASLEDGFVVAACDEETAARFGRLAALRALGVLVGSVGTEAVVVIPTAVIDEARELAASLDAHVGVSSEFSQVRDVRAAAGEAAQALETATLADQDWVSFTGPTLAMLTRSHREADAIINSTLGPLTGSASAVVKLRDTLFAYLRHDRQWQATADELGIHRQTLAHRLGRIEELTGLDLAKTSDLASLWIAYQAWQSRG